MHIPVHSPWLPGNINVTQTVLIILTMTELFLDRPHIHVTDFPAGSHRSILCQWAVGGQSVDRTTNYPSMRKYNQPLVIPPTLYATDPQPFWHHGLVLWKTIFPQTRGGDNGFGMMQAS